VLLQLLGERDELDALELEVGVERRLHFDRREQRDVLAGDLDDQLADGGEDLVLVPDSLPCDTVHAPM